VKKFNELLTESKQLFVDETGRENFEEKAENTRRSLESIMKELDEVKNETKKVKLH
jgi:hypothetical protein